MTQAPFTLHGLQVLVVEDHADSREALAEILTGFGAEVRTAVDAADGLRSAMASPPDILVSDIGLPDEDGYCLLAKLRAHGSPQLRAIPAVALTAYAGREDVRRAEAAGFSVHVAKPFDVERLISTIAELAAA